MYDAAMYGGWKECGKQRMDNKAKVRTMKRKDGTLWSFSLAGTPFYAGCPKMWGTCRIVRYLIYTQS